MNITSNQMVKRKDGSFARRIRLSCVSQQCPNYKKVAKTIYHEIEVVDDDSAE
jgi:hypothetical protein